MIVTAKIEKLENGKLVLKPDVDISRKNFGFIWNGISAPAACGSGFLSRIAI